MNFSRGPEDLLDVVDEAHVEHLVAFVEHPEAQVFQLERAALEVVLDAARCPDDDVDAAAQSCLLRLVLGAAVQTQAGEAVGPADGLEVRSDLLGELAGRGEDDAARGPAVGAAVSGGRVFGSILGKAGEALHDREHERQRLAAPRARPAHDVGPI
jgi:hypothetical protein